MNDMCRKMLRKTQCEPVSVGESSSPLCQPFSVCLPFGRRLVFNGECMSVEGTPNISDGEYGVIIVENGCIVGARPNPVFEYTPGPCAPAASPCGGSEGGSINLAPGICNLLSLDASGRLGAFLTVTAGEGVSVSGCGTTGSPLVISSKPADAQRTYVQSEDTSAITVNGDGTMTNPYVIGLGRVSLAAGDYGGFTIDEYGRVVAYKDPGSRNVTAVIEGPGIKVINQDGIATISLAESGIDAGQYLCGGYLLGFDLAGRVITIRQSIQLDEQQFDPFHNQIAVNELGSIIGVVPIIRETANIGRHHTAAIGTTVSDTITTDRRGSIYVTWYGYEPITTLTPTNTYPNNVYTDRAGAVLQATIGEIRLMDVMGKFVKYEAPTTDPGGGTGTTATQALIEFRAKTPGYMDPGTYTIEISKIDETNFVNPSVLEMCCCS